MYYVIRDMQSCFGGMLRQVGGEFVEFVAETTSLTCNIEVLERCGIVCAPEQFQIMNTGEMMEQDEMSDLFGDLVFVYASRRMAHCSFLIRGWPLRMVGVCGDGRLKRHTVGAFQEDLGHFRTLAALPHKSAAARRLWERSCFQDVAVQQCIQARHCVIGVFHNH